MEERSSGRSTSIRRTRVEVGGSGGGGSSCGVVVAVVEVGGKEPFVNAAVRPITVV